LREKGKGMKKVGERGKGGKKEEGGM